MAVSVKVAFGQECVIHSCYGLGSSDMQEVAHMGLHVAQMTSQKGIRQCFDAMTVNAAKVMHLEGYELAMGLAMGCDASFVLLQARDPVEAIRLTSMRMPNRVIRNGCFRPEADIDDVAELQKLSVFKKSLTLPLRPR